jgi:Type IV secretory pathway, component VirB8
MRVRQLTTLSAFRASQELTRVLIAVVVVLGLINIIAVGFIISLFPLKEIQPMLLSVSDKADQIVKVEPLERNQQGIDLMIESLCRNYVFKRETFDLMSEEARYEELKAFSATEVMQAFLRQMNAGDSALNERHVKHITRSVIIKSCAPMGHTNLWQVEWEAVDVQEGDVLQKQVWVSNIEFDFVPKKVRYEDRFINPLGFEVIRYGVSRKG